MALFLRTMFVACSANLVSGGGTDSQASHVHVPALDSGDALVDTLFISDPHVNEFQNTWASVEAAFANFRKDHPDAPYLVYTGDTIRHSSAAEDGKADQYLDTFISLAKKHNFTTEHMFIAMGNNDGPHDRPLSAKWSSALVGSGVVPAAEHTTAAAASYYAKCAGVVCAIVVNTDLEVYSSGVDEDKAPFNATLTPEELRSIYASRDDQRAWVAARAKAYLASGQRLFVMGHHPALSRLFDADAWGSKSFMGGVAGHLHVFFATGSFFGKKMLTLLPGYTSDCKYHGYVASALQVKQLQLNSSMLVSYDYGKKCFYPYDSGSCAGTTEAPALLVV